jgi:hypothetical protein
MNWFEKNNVPPPTVADNRAESVRLWHPDYGIGDTVRRRTLGAGAGVGRVVSFGRHGVHLTATVRIFGHTETFIASEYVAAASGS